MRDPVDRFGAHAADNAKDAGRVSDRTPSANDNADGSTKIASVEELVKARVTYGR